MRLKEAFIISVVIMLLASVFSFSQSRQTGAIQGRVADDQGSALPGANLTLTSPNLMGVRTFVSDSLGEFRFPALPPGVYTLKAELQGFVASVQENIRLTTTVTLTVDFSLHLAKVAEQVTVIAKSPTVDVKSTETASVTLGNEILRNIPYSQFTSDIVNLAPGVNEDTAYGASNGTGISWQMDGVGVGDPAGGTAWVFLDHNIIEEAKVMGIGLPAEYGAFTGVIFNLITKSGGNAFSGHVEMVFQGKKSDWPKNFWQGNNGGPYAQDFGSITAPNQSMYDANIHLGGPIVKDKLWFYGGAQLYRMWNYPTGFDDPKTGKPLADRYNEPRGFFKLTSQISSKINMSLSVERDNYSRTNRGASSTVLPEATESETGPEWVVNFNLTDILSPQTFFDVKGAFFNGQYTLEPQTGHDVSGHFYDNDEVPGDGSGNKLHDSWGAWSAHPRTRYQANASLTHYAENFLEGNHEFKFGVEFEHSIVHDLMHYTGANHWYYEDYWGYWGYPNIGNYLATQYAGYDVTTKFVRLEAFAQDSWQVGKRLNVNLGLRFSQNWGSVQDRPGTPWNTHRIAPRIGFTFDLLGDKTTILKAHYGQFTEAMYSYFLDRLNNNFSDKIKYYWVPTEGAGLPGEWIEYQDTAHGIWNLAPGIKQPYLSQFTVGIERELFKDTSFSVTYINRAWKNPVGAIDNAATWELTQVYNSALDRYFSIYELTSGDTHDFVITNLAQGENGVPVPVYRKYWGWEFLFNKRFSNRWQVLASYVYSRAYGTLDNAGSDDIGYGASSSTNWVFDPNFFISGFNADGTPILGPGNCTYNPTHMIKIQGTYVMPFDIHFNAYFHAISGDSWTTRVRSARLAQGRVTFNVEETGKYHYPFDTQLDLRLEKVFNLARKYQLGIILDVFNVFNTSTITSWGTRIGYDYFPGETPSTDGHDLYGITLPRRARVGLRLMF
jgi:hypothetical protein